MYFTAYPHSSESCAKPVCTRTRKFTRPSVIILPPRYFAFLACPHPLQESAKCKPTIKRACWETRNCKVGKQKCNSLHSHIQVSLFCRLPRCNSIASQDQITAWSYYQIVLNTFLFSSFSSLSYFLVQFTHSTTTSSTTPPTMRFSVVAIVAAVVVVASAQELNPLYPFKPNGACVDKCLVVSGATSTPNTHTHTHTHIQPDIA